MKYLVDVEKLRTIFFNKLASGRVEGPSITLNNEGLSITLNNIEYVFDNDLEITKLRIVDRNKKAFVITTKGYVEFTPLMTAPCDKAFIVINQFSSEILNLNYIFKQIKEHKTDPLKVGTVFFCNGNVCLSEANDAIYLSEKNFVGLTFTDHGEEEDRNFKILSDDMWWTFDFSEVREPSALAIKVDNKTYGFGYVPKWCKTMKIRKGSCVYMGCIGKIFCM